MAKKVRALITAVGGRSVGYQILECLKLVRKYYHLIATDMDAFSPGLFEADEGYLLPSASSKEFIPTIMKLAKKKKIDVILPGSQPEVKAISYHQKLFEKARIVPIVAPYHLIENLFDKLKLYCLLQKHNISTPKTLELVSVQDAKKLKFPIVVKPVKDSSGSKNIHILKDLNELSFLFYTLANERISLLAQEYVGSEAEEYTVGVIVGKDGRVVDAIVMKRYLTGLSRGEEREINGKKYVLSTGYSQGFFVDAPNIKTYCEHVAKVIGARGPLNIQLRMVGKKIYIFEIHPRFSGSASQRAEVGFNEPHVLIQDFLGIKRYHKVPHKLGYAVIRKFANTVVDKNKFNQMKKHI